MWLAMKKSKYTIITILTVFFIVSFTGNAYTWHDETHIAIAKVTGYAKWFNATGADMAKLKAGDIEKRNHYVNNPRGTAVTPEMVFQQVNEYNNTNDLTFPPPRIVNLEDVTPNKSENVILIRGTKMIEQTVSSD
jgi:predicted membrane protein